MSRVRRDNTAKEKARHLWMGKGRPSRNTVFLIKRPKRRITHTRDAEKKITSKYLLHAF